MARSPLYFDFSRPFIEQVADHLWRQYAGDQGRQLEQVIAVLPSARAGRLLLQHLARLARRTGRPLYPPQVVTPEEFTEQMYSIRRRVAGEQTRVVAWIDALRAVLRRSKSNFFPHLPDDDDLLGWHQLARLMSDLHRELAGGQLTFADVLQNGIFSASSPERQRWKLLQRIQDKYLDLIERHQLVDPDMARRRALENHEVQVAKDIVLIGTVDLNRLQREMLARVASRVQAFICAPASLSDRFGSLGELIADAWMGPLPLQREQMEIVDGPTDQVQAVVRCLERWQSRFRSDQLAIAAPDPRLVPYLERGLTQAGVTSHWVAGRPLEQVGLYQLGAAIADYLDRPQQFSSLATLVRHPDVDAWLDVEGIRGDWLAQLDDYHSKYLPAQLEGGAAPLATNGRDSTARDAFARVHDLLRIGLAPLTGVRRPIGQWSSAIAEVMGQWYRGRWCDGTCVEEYPFLAAADALRTVLWEQQQVPESIGRSSTAAQALRIALAQIRTAEIPLPRSRSALDLIGWLDAPWDPASAMIVTSFNEGHVPASINAHPFLPNHLRRALGLPDNRQRYARDAYALHVLAGSRAALHLIGGRRDTMDNPLPVSRLAFASHDRREIAERCRQFFHPPAPQPRIRTTGPNSAGSIFEIPHPEKLPEPIRSIRVTAFRSYLACPYRFYLAHVLGLKELADDDVEMNAAMFGNLLHQVLEAFGRHALRESTDSRHIREFLLDALRDQVRSSFGSQRLPAVEVQLMQMRSRLQAFADWQAEWRQKGWRIAHVEAQGGTGPVTLDLAPDPPMILRGIIDRIDRHEQTGDWVIFDYKTADSAKWPDETHRSKDTWVDLQLPLYRHFAQAMAIEGNIRLAYILLPKQLGKTGAAWANWSDADLQSADGEAVRVARAIRNQLFWPPADPPPRIWAEFAPICQQGTWQSNAAAGLYPLPAELRRGEGDD